MLLSMRSLDLALKSFTVELNLKLLETINQLRKLKLEKQNKRLFNNPWNLIQVTLTLILEANILYKVIQNPLWPMVLKSKVNWPRIKWNLSSKGLKLNMINKVFLIWVKNNYNQKFWMKLLKIEMPEKNLFSKSLLKKFKKTKTFQNRTKRENKNLRMIMKKMIIDTTVPNNFWLPKLTETLLDPKWSVKVKVLSLLALPKCCLSNRFKKRTTLEVFLQLNFWLKVFNN
jgi:hypothetical protein